MKVEMKSLTDEGMYKRDYRNRLEIYVNDKRVFLVREGEPEDANLSRDFNDCWRIGELMKAAYDAGKNGEGFELIFTRLDEM